MKTILLYFSLLISGLTLAQTGINYKALVKDGSGNVLSSQMIDVVEFTVIKNIGTVEVYKELHENVMTDANGIIILTIGGGVASIGNYALIDWGSDSYALKTQIDIGGGLVNLNTIELQEVPFAATARNISDAPSRTLEVAGIGDQKLRIKSDNGNGVALELMRTGTATDWKIEHSDDWLDILTSDDDFATEDIKFSFHQEGRFGINNVNPAEELHVTGTIRSTDLAGTGTRNVVANALGNLVMDSETKYIALNPTAFNAKTPSGVEVGTTVIRGLAMSGQSGDKVFQANVNIPHGATMRNIWVHYVDSSASSDITIQLKRRLLNSNTDAALIFDTATSGGSTAIRVLTASSLITIAADNFTYSYYIYVRSTSWQNNQYVKGIVIGYTE